MSVTIFVPGDAAALAVGADPVAATVTAEAERRGIEIRLVRNGSRGLFWLEPLLEVTTPDGRIAYGPVEAADVPGLFDAGLIDGGDHPLRQGPVKEIPYLAKEHGISSFKLHLQMQGPWKSSWPAYFFDDGSIYSVFQAVAKLGPPAIALLHCENWEIPPRPRFLSRSGG